MSHHVIEIYHQCKSCDSTGLYVGLAERDGSAVVCHTCKGSGRQHTKIEYDDFEGRLLRADVHHVVQANPGIVVGTNNGQYQYSDFGGMSYRDWSEGKPFPQGSENRRFTCPAWWYQTADYAKKPEWKECDWGLFSSCKHFGNKAECWKRWDRENPAQINGV
jgi:hypothetical protein